MPKIVKVTKEQTSRRPMLDYAGAAEYLGLTEKFMRRLVAEKRISHVKPSSSRTGRVYFNPDTLDAWVESNTVPAAA